MEIIHKHFSSIHSTNDWAKSQLHTLCKKRVLLVTADEQTAARGQYGRAWFSPKNENIYATFAFYSSLEPFMLTRLLALSAAKIVQNFQVICDFKWPNDLVVNQKKIAGILCETSNSFVVIGIGLNVNMTQEALLHIDQAATSLYLETGKIHDLKQMICALTEDFVSKLQSIHVGSNNEIGMDFSLHNLLNSRKSCTY